MSRGPYYFFSAIKFTAVAPAGCAFTLYWQCAGLGSCASLVNIAHEPVRMGERDNSARQLHNPYAHAVSLSATSARAAARKKLSASAARRQYTPRRCDALERALRLSDSGGGGSAGQPPSAAGLKGRSKAARIWSRGMPPMRTPPDGSSPDAPRTYDGR